MPLGRDAGNAGFHLTSPPERPRLALPGHAHGGFWRHFFIQIDD